jgi:hypothetical protein
MGDVVVAGFWEVVFDGGCGGCPGIASEGYYGGVYGFFDLDCFVLGYNYGGGSGR